MISQEALQIKRFNKVIPTLERLCARKLVRCIYEQDSISNKVDIRYEYIDVAFSEHMKITEIPTCEIIKFDGDKKSVIFNTLQIPIREHWNKYLKSKFDETFLYFFGIYKIYPFLCPQECGICHLDFPITKMIVVINDITLNSSIILKIPLSKYCIKKIKSTNAVLDFICENCCKYNRV